MKKLFLDDIRVPGDVTWINIDPGPWAIVRSCDEAIDWVKTHGFPEIVSFDHDLGYEEWDTDGTTGIVIVTSAVEEKSGLDFAKWLISRDLDTASMPADFRFTVHSMNPIGTANITKLLENYISFKKR
jgi:hypothetical protein